MCVSVTLCNVTVSVYILLFPSALWTPDAHVDPVCLSQTHQA